MPGGNAIFSIYVLYYMVIIIYKAVKQSIVVVSIQLEPKQLIFEAMKINTTMYLRSRYFSQYY